MGAEGSKLTPHPWKPRMWSAEEADEQREGEMKDGVWTLPRLPLPSWFLALLLHFCPGGSPKTPTIFPMHSPFC